MAGQLTIDTLRASTGVLATQNGMTGIAKAWVNFAGATGTINGSFNVSSVTRSSAGNYTVNFTTAMANTNYVAQLTQQYTTAATWGQMQVVTTGLTTSALPMTFGTFNAAAYADPVAVHVSIMGA